MGEEYTINFCQQNLQGEGLESHYCTKRNTKETCYFESGRECLFQKKTDDSDNPSAIYCTSAEAKARRNETILIKNKFPIKPLLVRKPQYCL